MTLELLNEHLAAPPGVWDRRFTRAGGFVLRYSLVFFFLAFGADKFTQQEAEGIAPLIAHSPFLFWVDPLLGLRGGSAFIGVIEIGLGLSMALRRFNPRLAAYGSLGTALVLLTTLSFLFTTPGLNPQSADAGFLLKDLTLFGAALWSAGEAFAADRFRSALLATEASLSPTHLPDRSQPAHHLRLP